MQKEIFPHQESEFDKLLKRKEAGGWHFAGKEGLTQTKFSGETVKFEEVPFQTEDSIKEKYLREAKGRDPSSEFEVDLVLNENMEKLRWFRKNGTEEEYRKILKNLREEDRNYFVFIRKKPAR